MYNKNMRKKRKSSPPPVVIPFTHPEYVTQLANSTIEEEDEFSDDPQDSTDYLNPAIYNVDAIPGVSQASPQTATETQVAAPTYPTTPSPTPEDTTQPSASSPKSPYRTPVANQRPAGWAFMRASLVGLSLIAFLAVVFAILSTKYPWVRSEAYKYDSKSYDTQAELMQRSGTSDDEVVCPSSPPAVNNCLTWNWNEEKKGGGTVILYECPTRRGVDVVLILVCDCATWEWKVVRNSTKTCDCKTSSSDIEKTSSGTQKIPYDVETMSIDLEEAMLNMEKTSPEMEEAPFDSDEENMLVTDSNYN